MRKHPIPVWTGDAVKAMHLAGITVTELAEHLGYGRNYVSGVLNGMYTPDGARKKFLGAIDDIRMKGEKP